MDTYSFLRQFADSWGLLAMCAFFLGIVIWAFRPGAGRGQQDAANIPFRHDDRPAAALRADPAAAGRTEK
jgi:cytochrome c oxidase cbb3-type subunit 4